MSKPTRQEKPKRGPKPGQGGRPPGQPRSTVQTRPLVTTLELLRARYPGMTDNKAATMALDALAAEANDKALAQPGRNQTSTP